MLRITELWRYPVKSMGGERLDVAEVRPGGIVGDRRYALRHAESGKLISAKRPQPYGRLLEWSARTAADGSVTVVEPDGTERRAGEAALNVALSAALGEPVRMVEVADGIDGTYESEWPEIPGTSLSNVEADFPVAMMTEKVSFVDLAALHIVVEQSMAHLADRSGAELGVERFRPNVLLAADDDSADGRFVDLAWRDVAAMVGDVVLHIADAAPRCIMTTLPQGRFGPAKEVLATLAAEARKESDFGTFACLGTYAEITTGGTIALGQPFALGA